MEIIYGKEFPKINFISNPTGGTVFTVESHNFVQTDDSDKDISWYDLSSRIFYPIACEEETGTEPLDTAEDTANVIKANFLRLTTTKSEQKFFEFYVDACVYDVVNSSESLMFYPALIPQVWVNWIHYDSRDTQRAERVQREPFRVDFLIKGKHIKDSPLIIEIDGTSHFGAYTTGPDKAMLAYTEHIRKDRWLRKQGWNVVRVSNHEVDCCQTLYEFQDLFEELTGWRVGVPF